MKKLKLNITTLSQIVLPANNNVSLITISASDISGSVIRGILADLFIRHQGISGEAHKNKDFRRFFFGNICFMTGNLMVDGQRSFPLPLSLQKSKEGNSILDLLVDMPKPNYKKIGGFGVLNGQNLQKASVQTRFNLHMSRNSEHERILGQSKDGGIYNFEAIEAEAHFQSYMVGSEKDLKELILGLGLSENKSIITRIGRSRNTEYGECLLEFGEVEEITLTSPNIEGNIIYLRLDSPLVPKEDFISAEDVVNDNIVEPLSEIIGEITCKKIMANSGTVNNFSAVWGLKQPETRILLAGSVIGLQKADGWQKNDIELLLNRLPQGFGTRTNEGFGQLAVWEPQSLNFTENLTKVTKHIPELSSDTEEMAKNILIQKITDQVKLYAHEDAKSLGSRVGTPNFWKRMEKLLAITDSRQSMKELLEAEKRDKSATMFVDYLTNIRIGSYTLNDILSKTEDTDGLSRLPYVNRNFLEDVCKKSQNKKQMNKLLEILSLKEDEIKQQISDGLTFLTYFREFFLHSRKLAKGGGIQ